MIAGAEEDTGEQIHSPAAIAPPDMSYVQDKLVDWVLGKEPKCDVGIGAGCIVGWLANRKVGSGWLVAACGVEALRCWCRSIYNIQIPAGTFLVVLLL